jgi:hypothetical protein
MNTLTAAKSRKSARTSRITAPDSLLDNECGFQALSRLNSVITNNISEISKDLNHELHSVLMVVMFSYIMYQTTKAKFIGMYYMNSQRIGQSEEFMDRMKCVQWGMNHRPAVVELHRKLYVLDVDGKDGEGKKMEFVQCKDIYEALLYWIFLMKTKYDDELLCGTKLKRFYAPILE